MRLKSCNSHKSGNFLHFVACACLLFLATANCQKGFGKEASKNLNTKKSIVEQSKSSNTIAAANSSNYILGPGDSLQIALIGIPGLDGVYSISPDGTLYIPRLRSLYAEGLTVEELRYFLTQQYKSFVRDPQVYIRPVNYRPVKVYIGGEITRPGYYVLANNSSGNANNIKLSQTTNDTQATTQSPGAFSLGRIREQQLSSESLSGIETTVSTTFGLPTLFDALRAAQGITPFSNLEDVKVVRRQPISNGGGKVQANINFLKLLTEGDESVNIRLYDGDSITVSKSDHILREILLTASRSNLSPDFIQVFVTGRVRTPGPQSLPQGATLNQAIASAGGPRLLRGKVEFLRFTLDGGADRRIFSYDENVKAGAYNNPILMTGDVIRINASLIAQSAAVLNELTGPAVGIYSVYSLFRP